MALISTLKPHARRHVSTIMELYPRLRLTSARRSRWRNRLVGGVPGSLHLSGRAADLSGTTADQRAALRLARRMGAVEAIDEGDHAHVAW
jgi:uncharacterized protein YcbK (DUF882 family)